MKFNKNGLDEMQREKRNRFGNQMFLIMFYALFIDAGLYGAGIRWLNYPSNIMVIIMVCMSVYLARTIFANAYLPPKAQNKKTVAALILSIVFSVVCGIAAFALFGNFPARSAASDLNDNSALILFIVSAVGLIIALIAAVIRKINDRNDSDN
jgi:hypothetical protein